WRGSRRGSGGGRGSSRAVPPGPARRAERRRGVPALDGRAVVDRKDARVPRQLRRDRKSTRLNSSHEWISYAVFCLKKKKKSLTQKVQDRQTKKRNMHKKT